MGTMHIVLALVGLGFLIFVHEFGHYLAARLGGMRVKQLALGYGPRLFGIRRGETDYRVNLFPFGGYVMVEGYQQDEAESADDPRQLQNRPAWVRAGYYAAGPFLNFFLSAVLIAVTVGVQGIPAGREVRIQAVEPGSPAERAGLMPQDTLVEIQGSPVTGTDMVSSAVAAGGEGIALRVRRDGREIELTTRQNQGRIGVMLAEVPVYSRQGLSLGRALAYTGGTWWGMTTAIADTAAKLFTGRVPLRDFSGPVGMVSSTADAASYGWVNFLLVLAFIGINLGFLNLLPLPALDGGRLILLALEKLIGFRLSVNKQAAIHLLGFVGLFILLIWISVLDFTRLGR